MIEGLKIDVTSEELVELLLVRERHHHERSEAYAGKVTAMTMAGIQEMPASGDPMTGLKSKTEEHQKRAAVFAFLREHVIPDETYRLTENDLHRLEIISRYY